MQMRLGHSSAGDVRMATELPLDPASTAVVPSSQIRPMCLSSQAPPKLSVASANSRKPSAAGEREAKVDDGRGRGNLMGTPWRPLGISRELRPAFRPAMAKVRKAAPCYLHDRSCQASASWQSASDSQVAAQTPPTSV